MKLDEYVKEVRPDLVEMLVLPVAQESELKTQNNTSIPGPPLQES